MVNLIKLRETIDKVVNKNMPFIFKEASKTAAKKRAALPAVSRNPSIHIET
jgi:hypothetical protein